MHIDQPWPSWLSYSTRVPPFPQETKTPFLCSPLQPAVTTGEEPVECSCQCYYSCDCDRFLHLCLATCLCRPCLGLPLCFLCRRVRSSSVSPCVCSALPAMLPLFTSSASAYANHFYSSHLLNCYVRSALHMFDYIFSSSWDLVILVPLIKGTCLSPNKLQTT